MSEFKRLLHWGPITALTIITVLFVCALLATLSWYPPTDLGGLAHLGIFCVWVYLILREFFKASFDGPGLVPLGWRPVRNAVLCEFNLLKPFHFYLCITTHKQGKIVIN